jgi:hypothetical protein
MQASGRLIQTKVTQQKSLAMTVETTIVLTHHLDTHHHLPFHRSNMLGLLMQQVTIRSSHAIIILQPLSIPQTWMVSEIRLSLSLHRSLAWCIAIAFASSIAKSRSLTSHRACGISNILSQSSSSHVLLVDIHLRARTLRQLLHDIAALPHLEILAAMLYQPLPT